MQVTKVELDKDVAEQKYKEYLEAAKTRQSREYNALRRVYYALKKGYKVIDIYQAFNDTGKDEYDRPKLAIVRADAKQVYFAKEAEGAGRFTKYDPDDWRERKFAGEVYLPESTFESWKVKNSNLSVAAWANIFEDKLVTNVPIIPAHIPTPKSLDKYYILFEVDKWSKFAPVKDPYLLERINSNTFLVLAEWNVTDVEAIVMRGR
jgi:hypothetical protein